MFKPTSILLFQTCGLQKQNLIHKQIIIFLCGKEHHMMYCCIMFQLVINFHLYLVCGPTEHDKYDDVMKHTEIRCGLYQITPTWKLIQLQTLFSFFCVDSSFQSLCVFRGLHFNRHMNPQHSAGYSCILTRCCSQSPDFYKCFQFAAFTWPSRKAFFLVITKFIHNKLICSLHVYYFQLYFIINGTQSESKNGGIHFRSKVLLIFGSYTSSFNYYRIGRFLLQIHVRIDTLQTTLQYMFALF